MMVKGHSSYDGPERRSDDGHWGEVSRRLGAIERGQGDLWSAVNDGREATQLQTVAITRLETTCASRPALCAAMFRKRNGDSRPAPDDGAAETRLRVGVLWRGIGIALAAAGTAVVGWLFGRN